MVIASGGGGGGGTAKGKENAAEALRYLAYNNDSQAAIVRAGGREALWKLRGHADTVVDVCFSPVYPQLATVCASGKLNFFCDGE